MMIVLPSDEPVDVRTVKNLKSHGQEKPDEDHDSDDDLLKDFSTVFEPTNSISSYATSVSLPF